MGNCFYSVEWVWNSRTKFCCIASGNWNVSRVSLQEFDIWSNISKIYERCMHKQMSDYLGNFFSSFQCGYLLCIRVQHCLLAMIEKWKNKWVDKGKSFGAILTDLSITFDCLPNDLIIVKLNAYCFSLPASKLIHNNLSSYRK